MEVRVFSGAWRKAPRAGAFSYLLKRPLLAHRRGRAGCRVTIASTGRHVLRDLDGRAHRDRHGGRSPPSRRRLRHWAHGACPSRSPRTRRALARGRGGLSRGAIARAGRGRVRSTHCRRSSDRHRRASLGYRRRRQEACHRAASSARGPRGQRRSPIRLDGQPRIDPGDHERGDERRPEAQSSFAGGRASPCRPAAHARRLPGWPPPNLQRGHADRRQYHRSDQQSAVWAQGGERDQPGDVPGEQKPCRDEHPDRRPAGGRDPVEPPAPHADR